MWKKLTLRQKFGAVFVEFGVNVVLAFVVYLTIALAPTPILIPIVTSITIAGLIWVASKLSGGYVTPTFLIGAYFWKVLKKVFWSRGKRGRRYNWSQFWMNLVYFVVLYCAQFVGAFIGALIAFGFSVGGSATIAPSLVFGPFIISMFGDYAGGVILTLVFLIVTNMYLHGIETVKLDKMKGKMEEVKNPLLTEGEGEEDSDEDIPEPPGPPPTNGDQHLLKSRSLSFGAALSVGFLFFALLFVFGLLPGVVVSFHPGLTTMINCVDLFTAPFFGSFADTFLTSLLHWLVTSTCAACTAGILFFGLVWLFKSGGRRY